MIHPVDRGLAADVLVPKILHVIYGKIKYTNTVQSSKMDDDDKQYLLDAVHSVINILDRFMQSGDTSIDFQRLLLKLDYLQRLLVNLDVDDSVVERVQQASNILFNLDQANNGNPECSETVPVVNCGRRGRPSFDIKEDQLSFLVEKGFKVADISKVIGRGVGSIKRLRGHRLPGALLDIEKGT